VKSCSKVVYYSDGVAAAYIPLSGRVCYLNVLMSWSGKKTTGSCFHAQFPMCPTFVLGGFRQSETGPIDYRQFARWRQQTGSSYAMHMDALGTRFFRLKSFPIDSGCHRHVQCGSIKNTWWAIIAEVRKSFVSRLYIDRFRQGQLFWDQPMARPSCAFQDGCRESE